MLPYRRPADRRTRDHRRGVARRSQSDPRPDRGDPDAARSRRPPTLCARAIAADGLVHLFGTGHSRIPLEEMFPRYGSYPGFHPIAELSMTFHTQVAGRQRPAPGDVHRAHGGPRRGHPLELPVRPERRDDGLLGVGADGGPHRDGDRRAGARPAGRGGHLGRPVDGPPARPPDRHAAAGPRGHRHRPVHARRATRWSRSTASTRPIGPGSTVANAAIVNEIKVQTAERLIARGRDAAGHHEQHDRRARTARPSCSRAPIASTPGASAGCWPARPSTTRAASRLKRRRPSARRGGRGGPGGRRRARPGARAGPTASRPRSSTPSIASGLRDAAATAAGSPTPLATRFRTAVSSAMTEPASVEVPTSVTRCPVTSISSPPIGRAAVAGARERDRVADQQEAVGGLRSA